MLNKRDLMPDEEAQELARSIVRRLRFRGPHFLVSGATGRGTQELCAAAMSFLEERAREERAKRLGFRRHLADARGKPALVPRRLVAMDDLLRHQRVDHAARLPGNLCARCLCYRSRWPRSLLRNAERIRERSAMLRARMLFGLARGFFRRLRISHSDPSI